MFQFKPPYIPDPKYATSVAYFSMEYAIEQPLKIYSGGLGYLAGSHLRSAYQLKQNMIGVGILWKYGYYDQIRKSDQTMDVLFLEKHYAFIQPTDIRLEITVNHSPVIFTAYYLPPDLFGTAPLFLLSTDLPENDYLAHTICYKLYDPNSEAKIAAGILLGIGGGKLLEAIGVKPTVYHLNESYGLPIAFYLYNQYKTKQAVQKRLVFTNHTPEQAGNQKTDSDLLDRMGYFNQIPLTEVQAITNMRENVFDHTMACLNLSKISNGVSKMHTETLFRIYGDDPDICPITHITNAQNAAYWMDKKQHNALLENDDITLADRKRTLKRYLFEEVADQTGEIYHEHVFTIVWARRFAGYKRADLLLRDMQRFDRFATNTQYPVQILWAGKPYPFDYDGISAFNRIENVTQQYPNCATLVGYELKLSKLLKQGADLWLNTPRVAHEASGTSGMTAAMNGAVNLSTADGWVPEFAKHGHNAFIIPTSDLSAPEHEVDDTDADHLFDLLWNTILPLYYDRPNEWLSIVKNSMTDILPYFDSRRLAEEYYEKMYL